MGLFSIFGGKAEKNYKKVLDTCNSYIEKYERENREGTLSAKEDLDTVIKQQLDASKQELGMWPDSVDYVKVAHTLLAHSSFDLLATGRYNVYTGVINPMSCAPNLLHIYKKAMEYGKSIGMVTDAEIKEQYDMLMKQISEVG